MIRCHGAARTHYSTLTIQEVALAYEVAYLIIGRPGARGLFAIGLLVIALIAGGVYTAETTSVKPAQSKSGSMAPSEVTPTPAITRYHSETATLHYMVDAGVQLLEHVTSAVRPPQAVTPPMHSLVTHYGEQYNGQILGCGNGYYASDNPTIVAVGPEWEGQMPCGTLLQICGAGGCIVAQRQDSCPGCSPILFDLSESAFATVCGVPSGVCNATVSIVQPCDGMDLGWEDRPQRERTSLDDLAEAALLASPPSPSSPTPAIESPTPTCHAGVAE